MCKKTIDRQNTVQSVIWLPTGDGKTFTPKDQPGIDHHE